MKKFEKITKGNKHLVFLDFEGTQFSHEMIALGAVEVTIDRNGRIKKWKKPFKVYVKAKNKIGKYVVELTGITEEKLAQEGIRFSAAMEQLKKYCGLNFKKSSFITFGSHDLTILNHSIQHSFDFPKEICQTIQKNYVDFLAFIGEFVKDSKGNQLSLHHFCELFEVEEEGIAHDPCDDAVNLAKLYDAVNARKDIVLEEYKKVLSKFPKFPEPVNFLIKKISEGKTVSPVDFDDAIRKYIE